MGTGMLMSGRRRQREALAEYSAAEDLQPSAGLNS
jgi:hypothetical protein